MDAYITNRIQRLQREKCIFLLSSRSLVLGSPRRICITTDIRDPGSSLLFASLPLVLAYFLKVTSRPTCFQEHDPSSPYSKQEEEEEKGMSDEDFTAAVFILRIEGI